MESTEAKVDFPSTVYDHHLVAIYCLVAACAIMIYDALITLDKSVPFMWFRKLDIPTALLIALQASTVVVLVSSLVMFIGPENYGLCYVWSRIRSIFLFVGLLANAAFSALRVWAISENNKIFTVTTSAIALVAPAIIGHSHFRYEILTPLGSLPPLLGGCIFRYTVPFGRGPVIGLLLSLSLSEAGVLATIWSRMCGGRLRRTDILADCHRTFSSVVIEYGTLHFCILSLVNLVVLGITQAKLINLDLMLHLIFVFTSVLSTRFLLNLRSFDFAYLETDRAISLQRSL